MVDGFLKHHNYDLKKYFLNLNQGIVALLY